MATLQELLFQKKLDKELPERRAEEGLQEAKEKLAQDKRDIKLLEEWHISVIQARMLEWQSREMGAGISSPFEGEVLFCDRKQGEDQKMKKMWDHKRALIKTWYESKHSLNNIQFRENERGTMKYMRFGFYSADMEAKVRDQCLAGRHDFEVHSRLALAHLQTKMPARVTAVVKQFLPDYIDHLQQSKDLIQSTRPW